MNIEQFLTDKVAAAVSTLYGNAGAPLQIQKTRKEFEGDYTLVVFPLLKASRKSPEATATEIGEYLVANTPEIKAFNNASFYYQTTLVFSIYYIFNYSRIIFTC